MFKTVLLQSFRDYLHKNKFHLHHFIQFFYKFWNKYVSYLIYDAVEMIVPAQIGCGYHKST